ncbi:MAG: glycosyltransferase [Lactobacillales bacterium]|jgi:glycosyltransferase involved in cell wall biosynthesis|nr:glycosyltransferase [Lactobacillales bacterium]
MEKNHTYVISAYKQSEYLEDLIQSLINQTMPSEIIMYTSTPNEYISNLANKYFLSLFVGVGGSIGKDWNNALSYVKTPYATIAHQDDTYLPTYTEKIMKEFTQQADTLIAFSDYDEFKNGEVVPRTINLKIKKFLLTPIKWFPSSKFVRNRSLSLGSSICCPAVSYNLKQLNGFKFNEEMKVSLDWEAWTRIAKMDGQFRFISAPLMYHRIHSDSETTAMISDNTRNKEDEYMYSLFWPKFMVKLLMKFYQKSQATNSVQ